MNNDPRFDQGRRLSPDQGTLAERLDDIDGSACWDDEEDDDGDLTRCECVTGCDDYLETCDQ